MKQISLLREGSRLDICIIVGMDVDFIYFDVGGVVMLDFSKTDKWNDTMRDLGVKEEDLLKTDRRIDMEELKYFCGKESAEAFVEILKKEFHLNIASDYSIINDLVSRFEPNPSLTLIIKELKTKYKIGLLTNTYPKLHDAVVARGLLSDIDWDVVVDSTKVGFYKPQTEIYDIALERAHVLPGRVLFIDNTEVNVSKAKELGWNTILYDPANIKASNEAIKNFFDIL